MINELQSLHTQGVMRRYLFLTISLCLFSYVNGNIQLELINKLFDKYSKKARPVTKADESVHVSLQFFLQRIVNVDEKHQIITTAAGLVLNWTDVHLSWNPEEYGGFQKLWVNSDELWLPDVVLWNNADANGGSFMAPTMVAIEANGHVTYDTKLIFKSFCNIDFFKFPMDEQECIFEFGPWTTSNKFLKFNYHGDVDLSGDIPEAGEWKVDGIDMNKSVIYEMDKVELTIYVKRRPLFYIVNLIIPCLIIFALTLLGFSLPCDSGEKIGLSITILLSMAVFLTMSGDMMPPTAKDVPIISQFLVFTMVLVATSTGMNVIVLKFWHHGPDHTDVPAWLRKITMNKYVLSVLCMNDRFGGGHEQKPDALQLEELSEEPVVRSNVVVVDPLGNKVVYTLDNDAIKRLSPRESIHESNMHNTQPTSDTASVVYELKKIHSTLECMLRKTDHEDHENDVITEWKQVACVVDRLFLWFFVAFSLAMFFALTAQLYQ